MKITTYIHRPYILHFLKKGPCTQKYILTKGRKKYLIGHQKHAAKQKETSTVFVLRTLTLQRMKMPKGKEIVKNDKEILYKLIAQII